VSGRTGRTSDGWTPDGRTAGFPDDDPGDRTPDGLDTGRAGHRTGWTPDGLDTGRLDSRIMDGESDGWTPHAGRGPATDAMAGLLASPTMATTPNRWMPAGRSAGQRPFGRAATRTAQQQGPRGRAWPPPRPSAAGDTRPSSWRLGALLSCVGFGWYEGRAMGLRKGKGVRSGVGACVRAGGVLEWPWLWADVQVEGGCGQ
jgi:hypothetical protein